MKQQINCSLCNQVALPANDEDIPEALKICPSGHFLAHQDCALATQVCPHPNCDREFTDLKLMPHLLELCGDCGERIVDSEKVSTCANRHRLIHSTCLHDKVECSLPGCTPSNESAKTAVQKQSTNSSEVQITNEASEECQDDHSESIIEILNELASNQTPTKLAPAEYYPILSEFNRKRTPPSFSYRKSHWIPVGVAALILVSMIGYKLTEARDAAHKLSELPKLKALSLESLHASVVNTESGFLDEQAATTFRELKSHPQAAAITFSKWLSADSAQQQQKAIETLKYFVTKFRSVDIVALRLDSKVTTLFEESNDQKTRLNCLQILLASESKYIAEWISHADSNGLESALLPSLYDKARADELTRCDFTYLLFSAQPKVSDSELFISIFTTVLRSSKSVQKLGVIRFPPDSFATSRPFNFLLLTRAYRTAKIHHARNIPGQEQFERLTPEDIAAKLPAGWYKIPEIISALFRSSSQRNITTAPVNLLPYFEQLTNEERTELAATFLQFFGTNEFSRDLDVLRFNGLIQAIDNYDLDTRAILESKILKFNASLFVRVMLGARDPGYLISLFDAAQLKKGIIDFSSNHAFYLLDVQIRSGHVTTRNTLTKLLISNDKNIEHADTIFHAYRLAKLGNNFSPEKVRFHLNSLAKAKPRVTRIIIKPIAHWQFHSNLNQTALSLSRSDFGYLYRLFKFPINVPIYSTNAAADYFNWALSIPDDLVPLLISSYLKRNPPRNLYAKSLIPLAQACLDFPEAFKVLEANKSMISDHYIALITHMKRLKNDSQKKTGQ